MSDTTINDELQAVRQELASALSQVQQLSTEFLAAQHTQDAPPSADGEWMQMVRTIPGGGGGGGNWTGVVWFLGQVVQDFSEAGNWPENVTGEYLRIKFEDGSRSFVDVVGEDEDIYEYFHVATKVPDSSPAEYTLNNHTQGDIRVAFRPYYC